MDILGRAAFTLYLAVVVVNSAPTALGPERLTLSTTREASRSSIPGSPGYQVSSGQVQDIDQMIESAYKRGRPGSKAVIDPQITELDMKLTDEQWEAIHGKPEKGAPSKIAINDEKFRWTDAIIPYEIDSIFNENEKKIMRDAMDEWEAHTCIQFVPRTTQANYVFIISGTGCWSRVGMTGGKQELSLSVNGCVHIDVTMHELGHAIGAHHEQTRPDRDEHITLVLGNVQSGLEYNFDKYAWGYVKDFGLKYDYFSIMHYGQWAFSSNGKPTIVTKSADHQEVIGLTPGLSIRDIQTTLFMYKCSEPCDKTKCPSGVVISPHPECKCMCNTGIPGNAVIEWDGHSECKGPNEETDPCVDFKTDCDQRSSQGECDSNPRYMLRNCIKSCKICGANAICKDYEADCLYWALNGDCENNPSYMNVFCRKSCYVCGERPRTCTVDQDATMCAAKAAEGKCEELRDSLLERCPIACKACPSTPGYTCRNWHIECDQWKQYGSCEEQPEWMKLHCPKACGHCTGGNIPDCLNYAPDAQCNDWASVGECLKNSIWMLYNCAKACQICGPDKACIDRKQECIQWANQGDCTNTKYNPQMYFECPVSCDHCTPDAGTQTGTCRNYSPRCSEWASAGQCDVDPDKMLWSCARSCQICGPVTVCKDYYDQCASWASTGECDTNPIWMEVACARSCNSCPGNSSTSPTTTTTTTTSTQEQTTPTPKLTTPKPTPVITTPRFTTPPTTPPTTRPTTQPTTSGIKNDDCKDEAGSYYCQKLIDVDKYDCEKYPYWMSKYCALACGVCTSDKPCQDRNTNCESWKDGGECTKNPGYMLNYCPLSCDSCLVTPAPTTPKPTTITTTSSNTGGGWTTEFDKEWCPDYTNTEDCITRKRQGDCETNRSYMFGNCAETCQVCGSGALCKNYNTECAGWAGSGYCESSPSYMKLYCRKACGVCA